MIKIFHKTSSLNPEIINQMKIQKSNLITIHLRCSDQNDIEYSINRMIYCKGCASQELGDASQKAKKELQIRIPNQLGTILLKHQSKTLFIDFMTYLASGKLEFNLKQHFEAVFLLAGVFNVKDFFNFIIDNNILIPLQNPQCRQSVIKHSFDTFNDMLNQQGRYNFLHWLFSRYPKIQWLKQVSLIFEGEISQLQSFISEFIDYQTDNNLFNIEDLDGIIQIYEGMGNSKEQARQKVKRRIPWSRVSTQVLDMNKRCLKFTDQQIREILKQRLEKLNYLKEKGTDQELNDFKDRRDLLKKQFEEYIMKIGSIKLKLQLKKNGGLVEQSNKKKQENLQNSYQIPPQSYMCQSSFLQSNEQMCNEPQKYQSQNRPQPQQQYQQKQQYQQYDSYLDQSCQEYQPINQYQQHERTSQKYQHNNSDYANPRSNPYQMRNSVNQNPPHRGTFRQSNQPIYPDFQNHQPKNQQDELQFQANKVLQSQKKMTSNDYSGKYNNQGGSKQSGNITHFSQNSGCPDKKTVNLQCGCVLCHSCLKVRWLQRTQKYQQMQNVTFQPGDFAKYNIRCYKCNNLMSPGDAAAYNKAK